MSFYNTIQLDGEVLKEAIRNGERQQDIILDIFRKYPEKHITPSEIYMTLGKLWPITSIRRAITNLTNEGHLIKTDHQRIGLYEKPNYCWTLLIKRTPKRWRGLKR